MKIKIKQAAPAVALIAGTLLILAIKLAWISPANFCLAVILLMLICLFTETYTPALSMAAALAMIVSGSKLNPTPIFGNTESTSFLKLNDAFNGFSNPAVFTIGSLFVIAAAIRNTGIINLLAVRILKGAKNPQGVIFKLAAPLISMSAVFNNTPIVAIFIPSVREWAINHKISPSKLLLPLVYITTFGGLFSIIGTSTNILINELIAKEALANPGVLTKFSMFDFAQIAFPAAIIGVIYLVTIGYRLLPDRKDLLEEKDELKKYLIEMAVESGSPLLGKTIAQSQLKELPDLFLFGVLREGKLKTPIQDESIFRDGDRLVFTGEADHLEDLKKINGLSSPIFCNSSEINENAQIIEAIIPATSSLVGKTVEDVWFNQRYDATVIALHRNGENINSSLSKTAFKTGDTILMITGKDYGEVWKTSQDFYFVSGITRQQAPSLSTSTILMLIATLLMIVIPTVSSDIGIEYTAILAAIIITVIKKSRNIFMQIDWDVLVVIGSAFGISSAFHNSGAAAIIADVISNLSASAGPIGVLILLYIITNILTEFITNTAAAALIFPIAIQLGSVIPEGATTANPLPFIATIAFAASASFATPIGYQTNMMVYGPGGYKFSDYVKVGLPLNIIYCATTVFMVSIIW